MNIDDIRNPKHEKLYGPQYPNNYQAKSEIFQKQNQLTENFNRQIGGKNYHSPFSSKSVNRKSEQDLKNSYFINKSYYEEHKIQDNVENKSESRSPSWNSFDSQKERTKRNLIYGRQSFKEEACIDLNEQSISINNENFQMVFFNKKKNQFSDSVSTAGSSSKIKQEIQLEETFMKIEDFNLGAKLGSGKFGEVFIGQHKKSGFICAVKKISKQSIDQKLLIQMLREIKIQSFLNHPNIVKMYAFFSDKNYIYLILELCSSGQLYNFLKKKRKLSQGLAKNIIQQCLRALDYMHQNQIIHRDLKPQNIIYHNGLIKLCDFGWSISSKTMRQTFCGTPLYVSPELLKRKNYNNKIDVWSIGILTYQLLFGRVPFDISSERDFIKIVEDQIKFSNATQISDQAKQFISICLKKDPRQRYTVHELLDHPFIVNQEVVSLSEMY